jgi:hypothetical protein
MIVGSVAFGTLRRIRKECGPMINIPIRGVFAGIRILEGLVIRCAGTTGDDHDEEEGNQAPCSIVSYL